MKKTGILEKKLKTYYGDTNLSNYKENLVLGLSKYTGKKFTTILDIGSGVGSFADAAKPFGHKVYALEASDYGYDTCIKKGIECKKFFLEKGVKLPFEDKKFSLVFMNQVLEHVDKEVGQYYIKEIVRVLEPGGVAIINSPSKYCKIWDTDPNHLYCWRPNELYEEVNQYHTELESISLQRVPLEPWMFQKYNEEVINTWHKYNKYPKLKKFLHINAKILDKLGYKLLGTDRLLASSNIIFVKKA